MKKPEPNPDRILWRDFVHTLPCKAARRALRFFGLKLVIEFDENQVAKDTYIAKKRFNDHRPAAGTDEAIAHNFLAQG